MNTTRIEFGTLARYVEKGFSRGYNIVGRSKSTNPGRRALSLFRTDAGPWSATRMSHIEEYKGLPRERLLESSFYSSAADHPFRRRCLFQAKPRLHLLDGPLLIVNIQLIILTTVAVRPQVSACDGKAC